MSFNKRKHLGSQLGFNSGLFGKHNSGSSFSIAKSFYLDGVNKFFTIPKADLTSILSGSSKTYTLFFVVKRSEINDNQFLFGSTGQNIDVAFISNTIRVRQWDATAVKTLQTSGTFTNTSNFYGVTVVINGLLPSSSKIYINAIDEALAINTLTGNSDTTSLDYYLGSFNSSSSISLNGYYQQFAIVDYACNSAEIASWYNNGKPKDPQTLFRTNCKYFFNADNSGDTAPFTVTDSVNSINAVSTSLTDANKTPITPYTNSIADLVTKYGFLNAWSGENIEINGTTTTAKDYVLEHDLNNPTIASQPTFVGGSADFSNRPILDFDGIDDQLTKAVANWRSADSSGCFIAVVNTIGNYYFSTNNNLNNSAWFSMYKAGTNKHGFVKTGAVVVDSVNSFIGANVLGAIGTGVEFKEFVNGVDETNSPASYSWLDSLPTQRNDITMGAATRLSSIFTNCEVAFVGYMPYTDDATIIALQNELKTIFGI